MNVTNVAAKCKRNRAIVFSCRPLDDVDVADRSNDLFAVQLRDQIHEFANVVRRP